MHRRVALTALLMTLLPGTAAAAPTLDGTFNVGSSPSQITQGSDGNMWVLAGNGFQRIKPDGAVSQVFPLPAEAGAATDITASPTRLWIAVQKGTGAHGGVVEVNPELPGTPTYHDVLG